MPKLSLRTRVPARPAEVFEYITAHPAQGEAEEAVLERRYGKLVEHMGNIFRFQETGAEKTLWQCSFDPPHSRSMRAIDSNWSDRLDDFEATPEGTQWTVTWELKSKGLPSCTQWLFFHLRRKHQIFRDVMVPVVQHFRDQPGADQQRPY